MISKFRFPLIALLVFVTIVGLGVGVWSASYRLRQVRLDNLRLRHEVAALRRETGYLEVVDRQQIYAIARPSLEDLTWRWRIYVPHDDFELHWGFDGISNDGTDAQYSKVGSHLERGEQVLTCAIRPDDDDEQQGWKLICQSTLGNTMKVSLPNECRPWFDERQSVAFAVSGVGPAQVVSSPSEPAVLLRQRRFDFGEDVHQVKKEPPARKRDGLLLWIAPRGAK